MGSLVLAWFFHVNYWYYHQAHMLALAQRVQGYCGAVTFFSRLSFSLRVLHVSVHHQRLSLGISESLIVVWGDSEMESTSMNSRIARFPPKSPV